MQGFVDAGKMEYNDGMENKDIEHLRMLEIFYYVNAGLTGLVSLLFLSYIAMGGMILGNFGEMASDMSADVAQMMGTMFIVIGIAAFLLVLGIAVISLLAGRFLKQRRYRTFVFVVAGINCLNAPIGTALGVFTFIVLSRDSVKEAFEKRQSDLYGY